MPVVGKCHLKVMLLITTLLRRTAQPVFHQAYSSLTCLDSLSLYPCNKDLAKQEGRLAP